MLQIKVTCPAGYRVRVLDSSNFPNELKLEVQHEESPDFDVAVISHRDFMVSDTKERRV